MKEYILALILLCIVILGYIIFKITTLNSGINYTLINNINKDKDINKETN